MTLVGQTAKQPFDAILIGR